MLKRMGAKVLGKPGGFSPGDLISACGICLHNLHLQDLKVYKNGFAISSVLYIMRIAF